MLILLLLYFSIRPQPVSGTGPLACIHPETGSNKTTAAQITLSKSKTTADYLNSSSLGFDFDSSHRTVVTVEMKHTDSCLKTVVLKPIQQLSV